MAPLRWLLLLSVLFFVLRIYAATRVGFGDAEALYVTYGLHPQLVFLDHPGLVGLVARGVGWGVAPSPLRLHLVTAVVSTAIPWLGVLTSRWLGASREAAPLAGLALLAAPEISVGLFALTPDLLLAPLWLLAAGAWGRALVRAEAQQPAAPWALLGGGLAGVAAASKVSGLLLLAAMGLSLVVWRRPALRRVGLWGGFGLGLLIASSVVLGEWRAGFPMLAHRLVATQHDAGVSLRNAGALVGGQIGYLSPLVAVAAFWPVRALLRSPSLRSRWLLLLVLVSGLSLAFLCLWSRVAEPHWLAPAWLPVALALPDARDLPPPRLRRWALGSGVALSLLVHLWTLTDLAPRWLGRAYEGRFDLANDLLLWGKLVPRIVELRSEARRLTGAEPVILAPHWIVAAQAAATGGDQVRASTLACLPGRREVPDDFCSWEPPSAWGRAPLLWVSDDRFEQEPPTAELGGRTEALRERVELRRGGRVARGARLVLLLAP